MEKLARVKPGYDAWFAANGKTSALWLLDNADVIVDFEMEMDGETAYQCHSLYDTCKGAVIPARFIEFSKRV